MFFLYNDGGIQWTIGGERGFPGYGEAVVGISNRYGNNDIIIPYSTANIDKTSNVGIPGVWIFKVGTGINIRLLFLYNVRMYNLCIPKIYYVSYNYFIQIYILE